MIFRFIGMNVCSTIGCCGISHKTCMETIFKLNRKMARYFNIWTETYLLFPMPCKTYDDHNISQINFHQFFCCLLITHNLKSIDVNKTDFFTHIKQLLFTSVPLKRSKMWVDFWKLLIVFLWAEMLRWYLYAIYNILMTKLKRPFYGCTVCILCMLISGTNAFCAHCSVTFDIQAPSTKRMLCKIYGI